MTKVSPLTLNDAQRVLVLGKVPQATAVAAALESHHVEAFFQQVLDSDDAHGTCCRRWTLSVMLASIL